jgi:hypothetical protein
MIATSLILSAVLLAQAQTPAPKAKVAPAPKGNVASAPKGDDAPATKVMTPAERAQQDRGSSTAKKPVVRSKKAQFQAAERARAAREEAMMRDYELKMAPIIAAQQVEMARIQAQQEQAAIQQQFQQQRIALENQRLQLEYWRSQQPVNVIIRTEPIRP